MSVLDLVPAAVPAPHPAVASRRPAASGAESDAPSFADVLDAAVPAETRPPPRTDMTRTSADAAASEPPVEKVEEAPIAMPADSAPAGVMAVQPTLTPVLAPAPPIDSLVGTDPRATADPAIATTVPLIPQPGPVSAEPTAPLAAPANFLALALPGALAQPDGPAETAPESGSDAPADTDATAGTIVPPPPGGSSVPPRPRDPTLRDGSGNAASFPAATDAAGRSADGADTLTPTQGQSSPHTPRAEAGAAMPQPAVEAPLPVGPAPDPAELAQAPQTGPTPESRATEATAGMPVLSSLSHGAIQATAQIAAQIVKKLEGRATRFEMALTPDDLGRVDVSLDIDADGQLSARLAFDNPVAAADLRGRVDELRRQLTEAGFTVADDALSFDQREPSAGNGGAFDRAPDRHSARAFGAASRLSLDAEAALVPSRWMSLTLTPERVDMKV